MEHPVTDERIEIEIVDKDLRTGVETGNVQAVLNGSRPVGRTGVTDRRWGLMHIPRSDD